MHPYDNPALSVIGETSYRAVRCRRNIKKLRRMPNTHKRENNIRSTTVALNIIISEINRGFK